MKNTDLIVSRQNNVKTIRYILGVADVFDDKAADKMTQLNNVIPIQYSDEDGKRMITAYAHEETTLNMFMKKKLTKREVLGVMSGLVSVFEIGAQGIPVSYIVKDAEYIYINNDTLTLKAVLMPLKQDIMPLADMPTLFRDVISRMKFDEIDTDNYVAKILTVISSDDFSVEKLKALIDAQLEDIGMFYNKDNGLMGMQTGAGVVQNKEVKVNKIGVMNNMRPQQPIPQPMPQMVPKPVPQPMPQMAPKPVPQPMPQMAPNPIPQPMPQMAPNPIPQPMPQMAPKPVPQPMPQMAPNPVPQPMPQMVPQPVPQMVPQPKIDSGVTMGNLVGQLGTKPVPHMVRKKTGEIINITKSEFAIGKSQAKADYTIENNAAISRVHCIIVQKNGVNYIKDNNSTNHTYVNGVELKPDQEVLLKHKMTIQLGDEEFTFLLRKGD